MRLWHQDLISFLPRQQLLGQHRECCALRGNGWGKRHRIVNYIWDNYPEAEGRARLFAYHKMIMFEMEKRGYCCDLQWNEPLFRGKNCKMLESAFVYLGSHHFSEHNDDYFQECLKNLASKGIALAEGATRI